MTTKKKSYEEKIVELENKLLQRTLDLKMCQKENEEFIYIASHDLKAPLRKLSTFSSRLSEKAGNLLGQEGLSYLQRIEKTVAAMQSLVDSLSALSEIETGINFVNCDLNLIMNQLIKELEEIFQQKNATIKISQLPIIEANAAQMKEVFKNLINNSLLFQPEGQAPQIIVTSELLNREEKTDYNLDSGKEYYKIEFTDNGIGFNQEYANQIFKPFKRLHGKSTYPGNGLGLAICKKIVIMHQGNMYAKGNENAGSLFVLILPQIHEKLYADATPN